MSRYVKTLTYTGTFDGDTVVVELRPLALEDLLRIGGRSEATPLDDLRLYRELFPRYATKISGLLAADSTPVTVEDVATQAYFVELLSRAMTFLISKASPTDPHVPGGASSA